MSLSTITTRSKMLGVGVLCAAGGVGAGAVATATASTGSANAKTAHHARHHGKKGGREFRALREIARHSAQGSVVVHTKAGYKTISFERGTVDSVNGNQLTLSEGMAKDAYKTVTITVPSGARVRDNGKKAALSSVTAGQRVLVVQLPKRTVVDAHTPHQHRSTSAA